MCVPVSGLFAPRGFNGVAPRGFNGVAPHGFNGVPQFLILGRID